MEMLFRLQRKDNRTSTGTEGPESGCGCQGVHLSYAATSRAGLKTRCAFIGTFCRRCGAAYWTYLDRARRSEEEDIHKATRTRRCGEAELKDIAYEWTMRAYHLGIPINAIDIRITPIEALQPGVSL
jgi:hypothetical protein